MAKKHKTIDPLAQVKKAPAKVTALMLNPAASRNAGKGIYDPYETFPAEIFACKNLVSLEVYRAVESGEIPDAIGSLAKLKHLSIGGLTTTALPETIGKLAKLEQLDIAYMQVLPALPDSIGKLTKLRELQAPYAGLESLPESFGNLKALRVANFTNSKLASVPSTIWKCTALEELYLPDTVVTLPAGIAALTKLRVLSCSAPALASIATELPKLKLVALRLVGDYKGESATELPEQVCELKKLEHLHVGFLGLTSLPASLGKLANLVDLEIGNNKLSTVIDVIAELPKLKVLEYGGNPVAVSERRELDKLMKLSPAKRAAALAKRTKAAPKPEKPKKAKTKPNAPARVGRVASINASLSLIIADARVAKAWTGVGDGDDLDGSDWERARQALAKKDYAMVDVGAQSAVALSLGVGQGIADVFRVGDRFVVVESIADNTEDELFLEYVASAPQKPRSVANLAVPSKKLVMCPTTDAGDGEESLAIDVPAKISISIEAEAQSSWGRARRFFVTPA
jgi:hypothetical protein